MRTERHRMKVRLEAQRRLARMRRQRRLIRPPEPRYDEVYEKGVEWLDSLAETDTWEEPNG